VTNHQPHEAIGFEAKDCTSCMICVRECPAWCIELESHAEEIVEEGARRPRTVNVLDAFRIDFGLCMFCGICVEACPFDCLSWQEAVGSGDAQVQGIVAASHEGLIQGIDDLASWLPVTD
jgi:NADH-quinone oxidoreductase subunit I